MYALRFCALFFFLTNIFALRAIDLETTHPTTAQQTLHSVYQSFAASFHHLKEIVQKIPAKIRDFFVPTHPHKKSVAYVRYTKTDDICDQEKNCIALRKKRMKQTLSDLLGMQVAQEDMPTIALCFSGGGFRATLMSLGFLQGAQECGLLDNVLYISGLSGSTFTIAPWLASGKSLQQYRTDLATILKHGLDSIISPREVRSLFDVLMQKAMSYQPICTIDVFGAVIANTFLKNTTHAINPIAATMSDVQYDASGKFPVPVYTAIDGSCYPYEWLEFTPFEAGKKCNYIPLWSYGRTFKQGISTNFINEQTCGYFLGMFGSAYAVNLKEAVRATIGNISVVNANIPEIIKPPCEAITSLLLDSAIGQTRFFPALAPEFARDGNPEKTHIQAVDAGIDFNLPVPPLLRAARNIDMIIIYDASENITHGKELFCAQHYAQARLLPFARNIDFTNLHTRTMSIFKDADNPDAPVIVYIPRIKNEAFSAFDPDYCLETSNCGIMNFEYRQHLFDNLTDLPRFTVKQNIKTIAQEIKAIVQRKQKAHA